MQTLLPVLGVRLCRADVLIRFRRSRNPKADYDGAKGRTSTYAEVATPPPSVGSRDNAESYTAGMSVADQLREDNRRRLLRLTPAERIALALRLGEEDIHLYAAAHDVSRFEARARLRRTRHFGRQRSVTQDV